MSAFQHSSSFRLDITMQQMLDRGRTISKLQAAFPTDNHILVDIAIKLTSKNAGYFGRFFA